jgi:hypothetical protein
MGTHKTTMTFNHQMGMFLTFAAIAIPWINNMLNPRIVIEAGKLY